MDNFTPATESILRNRTLDNILDTYLKQLDKKLRTKEDCDTFISKIKADQAKFNTALKVLMDSKIKHDKGTVDDKQFKELTRTAYKDINQYCKTFKVKMSDFGGGGFDAKSNITKKDIIDFKQYVTKLIAGVNFIKKRRIALAKEMNSKVGEKSTFSKDMKNIDKQTENLTKSNATESGLTFEEIFNVAMESLESEDDDYDVSTEAVTISTNLGQMNFKTGWKYPLSINWNDKKINITVKASADKPEDGLTPKQTNSINMFGKNTDKCIQKMIATLKKCDSHIENYKPKTILINRDGSIAMLCDHTKEPNNRTAIYIKPSC